MDREFHRLREFFAKNDMELIKKKGSRVFDTSHGIFGVSSLDELYQFFQDIHLEQASSFVDLGSGDGRVVFLAALFTKATGIEADEELHDMAVQIKEELGIDCTLIHGDYTEENLQKHDVFFTYIDHKWPAELEANLRDCSGVLYSYQNIFSPEHLQKCKTFWVGQTPIVSYRL